MKHDGQRKPVQGQCFIPAPDGHIYLSVLNVENQNFVAISQRAFTPTPIACW
jgi:hypothetical protein